MTPLPLNLVLKRVIFKDTYTEGWLSVDGLIFCDTLEDRTRDFNKDGDLNEPGEEKIYGETAIPFGRYRVRLSMSNKFKKVLPEIIGVKHFEGIRMHGGLKPEHSLGCILVGKYNGDGKLTNNGAIGRLIALMEQAKEQGREIWINIV